MDYLGPIPKEIYYYSCPLEGKRKHPYPYVWYLKTPQQYKLSFNWCNRYCIHRYENESEEEGCVHEYRRSFHQFIQDRKDMMRHMEGIYHIIENPWPKALQIKMQEYNLV